MTMHGFAFSSVEYPITSNLLPNTVPINRLPAEVFVRIPRFFTQGKKWTRFPMNNPLIMMTHVCQSWRNVLLSYPGLWTQIDFSKSTQSQQEAFLSRSGKQLLDLYHFLNGDASMTAHMSITYDNLFRLRGLWITSLVPYLDKFMLSFSLAAAPELKHLEIENEFTATEIDIKLPEIFRGRMPKLTNLVLHNIDMNFRGFDFPSLTRFSFTTETEIPVQDLTSLFERCPLLEFVEIDLDFEQPTPPHKRVYLAALQELRLSGAASIGLLDHLILPACTTIQMLNSVCTRVAATCLHPSSIDHLPVTRGVTKAVAMPYSCVFLGPNGTLRFSSRIFDDDDDDYFTSFSPISVSHIKGLVVRPEVNCSKFALLWKHTTTRVCGVFKVLTEVEDLTIVSCTTEPFFTTLGTTADGGILLPGLRKLSVHVGFGDLDVPTLIRCAKARKEHSRLLEEVTIVWEKDPRADVVQKVDSLREFVGELTQRIGDPSEFSWELEQDGVYY